MTLNLNKMITESRNPASDSIDTLSTLDILKIINQEDKKVPIAVEQILTEIAFVIEKVAYAFQHNGRLFYCGAGTSGRLGILDASECPSTYGSPPDMVIGLIAGGYQAILKSVENAEDNLQLGTDDLKAFNFNKKDVLVGIAASGCTPYVLGAMNYAKMTEATVACISCNPNSEMINIADIAITPIVGPEVITGSSRMKAGTAQKLVLNMITTGAMIRIGKVYGNLMVDVEATNAKLIERQKHIVMAATKCDRATAEQALIECNNHCKTSIVMILTGFNAKQAKQALADNNGFIRSALKQNTNHQYVNVSQILLSIGGAKNIIQYGNCMTRLRITLHDIQLVDKNRLKQIPGVLGVNDSDKQLQIILGPGNAQTASDMMKQLLANKSDTETILASTNNNLQKITTPTIKNNLKTKQTSRIHKFLSTFATIFTPLIPGFIAVGLLLGFATLLKQLYYPAGLPTEATQQTFLVHLILYMSVFSKGLYAFLGILIGYNTQKVFGGSGINGAIIASLFILGYDPHATTGFFSNMSTFFNYTIDARGNIIGILLACICGAWVEKQIRKIISANLDMILTSTITLLIIGCLTYTIIMPIGSYLFIGMSWLFIHLNGNPFGTAILSSLFLIAVVFGIHQGFIPVYFALMETQGFNSLFPILAMAGGGQIGAAIAIYIKAEKNSNLRNQIRGQIIPGLLGIAEPLIYGVTLPRIKPFITACLGGGAGGFFIGLIAWLGQPIGLNSVFGPSGLVAIPLITSPTGTFNGMFIYISGLLISYLFGFIFTYLFTSKVAI